MLIKNIELDRPDENIIKLAANTMSNDGLLVYPTDTAYGLGVNALQKHTIEKLYKVKKRSFNKPTHIIVSDIKMMKKLCYLNPDAVRLYNQALPGPLTLILPKKKIVPDILTGGLNTVGIRIPNCAVTKMLSKLLSFPYTTPSANKSGDETPYSIDKVLKSINEKHIDFIIDAGELNKTPPSTIISVSHVKIKILREGPVNKSDIENILNKKIL